MDVMISLLCLGLNSYDVTAFSPFLYFPLQNIFMFSKKASRAVLTGLGFQRWWRAGKSHTTEERGLPRWLQGTGNALTWEFPVSCRAPVAFGEAAKLVLEEARGRMKTVFSRLWAS